MVTEPWEMRRSTGDNVAEGEEERPLDISWAERGELPLIAAIFSAVLESRTVTVTKTPSGKDVKLLTEGVWLGVVVQEMDVPFL